MFFYAVLVSCIFFSRYNTMPVFLIILINEAGTNSIHYLIENYIKNSVIKAQSKRMKPRCHIQVGYLPTVLTTIHKINRDFTSMVLS